MQLSCANVPAYVLFACDVLQVRMWDRMGGRCCANMNSDRHAKRSSKLRGVRTSAGPLNLCARAPMGKALQGPTTSNCERDICKFSSFTIALDHVRRPNFVRSAVPDTIRWVAVRIVEALRQEKSLRLCRSRQQCRTKGFLCVFWLQVLLFCKSLLVCISGVREQSSLIAPVMAGLARQRLAEERKEFRRNKPFGFSAKPKKQSDG
jgi:hypothetical protein